MRTELPWILALGLVAIAGVTDWRSRRIPNWLTVPSLLAGLGMNLALAGSEGFWRALSGAGLGLALLLPLVLLQGLGAGDWKLFGAMGAVLGSGQMLIVLCASVLTAGLMGALQITRRGLWRQTLRNMRDLVLMLLTLRAAFRPDLNIHNPALVKVPFGTAAAIATAAVYSAKVLAQTA